MAQHDYVIDNSTGANVRADINSALQAIVTNNSGSSAPSATFPFMLFADSAAGTMKIRNAADNAFIELFQLDGTFTLEDGSASTPALAFRDDLNTGIFSAGADTFNVATGGVERLELGATTIFNESGADVDFRIEGDTDANLFYVDAGNDRIGLATSTPNTKLHIFAPAVNSTTVTTTTCKQLGLWVQPSDGDNTTGNIYTGITLADGFAGMYGIDEGASARNGLGFFTGSVAAVAERLRIDVLGRVGIGTSPLEELHVKADAPSFLLESSNASGRKFSIQTSNDGKFFLNDATAGLARAVLDSSGNVGIGKTSASFKVDVAADNTSLLRLTNTNETGHGSHNCRFGAGGAQYQNLELFASSHLFRTFDGSAEDERMRIDSSGNVGIGTNSPTASSAETTLHINANEYPELHITSSVTGTAAGDGSIFTLNNDSSTIIRNQENSYIRFDTNGANERMRITNIGTMQVSNMGSFAATNPTFHDFSANSPDDLILRLRNTTSTNPYGFRINFDNAAPNDSTRYFIYCVDSSAVRFQVNSNGGIQNFQSNDSNLCDEREKKNIVSLETKWDKVKSWELKKFHYNEDANTDALRYGVIAQQVEEHCPEVLTDWIKQRAEDAVLDEDGNVIKEAVTEIARKGVKEQQMMWMAIKALQEAQTRIETLETKVAALEAA